MVFCAKLLKKPCNRPKLLDTLIADTKKILISEQKLIFRQLLSTFDKLLATILMMPLTPTQLLALDSEQLLKELEALTEQTAPTYQPALLLLWKVSLDPLLQAAAQTALLLYLSNEGLEVEAAPLAIFDSILTKMPWAGDYKELQQENYQKFVAATSPYEQLLIESPLLVHYYLDLGRKLHLLFGLSAESKICFEAVIKYDTMNAAAYYALARLAENTGDTDAAVAYYEQCLALEPLHLYGNLQMGILQATEKEAYEKAIEYYNKVIEIDPYLTEVYVRTAEAYYAQKDIKRAKQFITIALDINEFQEEALHLLGMIQWKNEDEIDTAIETFEKGLDHQIHGDSGLLLGSLGHIYDSRLGEYDKARTFYEKALKAVPNQPKILQRLVVLLENNYQDYGAIANSYEQFLTAVKQNVAVYTEYASFLIKYMHDYELAQLQLQNALEIDENDVEAQRLSRQIAAYVQEDAAGGIDSDNLLNDDDDEDDDDDFSGGGAAGDN